MWKAIKQMHKPTREKQIDRYRKQTSGHHGGEEMESWKNGSRRLRGVHFHLENECLGYVKYSIENVASNTVITLHGDRWYLDLSRASLCNVCKYQMSVIYT